MLGNHMLHGVHMCKTFLHKQQLRHWCNQGDYPKYILMDAFHYDAMDANAWNDPCHGCIGMGLEL